MEIEEFMREAIRQIHNSCDIIATVYPKKYEFVIRVNESMNVCQPGDFCAATIRVEI